MNIYQSDYRQKPILFELIRNHDNDAAKRHLENNPEEINLKGWMDDTLKTLFVSTSSELELLSLV